jgi:hypothetical protein
MSGFAGQDLFSSGPHTLAAGAWQRQIVRRGFAGSAGEIVLDLGARSRTLTQTGRLSADTLEELAARLEAIDALADGRVHELIDPLGQHYARVLLEQFVPQGPIQAGRGFFVDYRIDYRQLP